jgi:acyl dehydratase
MNIYRTLSDLPAVGEMIGSSEWMAIEQARIQRFADATDDHQWIHLDVERAASGPFQATVAHGFLTLSLLPRMMASAFSIVEVATSINYGLNRVRFPVPVRSGSRVRGHVRLQGMRPVAGGHQVELEVTVELERSVRPACVAEVIVLMLAPVSESSRSHSSSAASGRVN